MSKKSNDIVIIKEVRGNEIDINEYIKRLLILELEK